MIPAGLIAAIAELVEQNGRLGRVLAEVVSTLRDAPAPTSTEPIETVHVTVKTFCEAARVSRSTVYKWFNDPTFPATGAGRFRRIDLHAAQAWIAAGGPAARRHEIARTSGIRMARKAVA